MKKPNDNLVAITEDLFPLARRHVIIDLTLATLVYAGFCSVVLFGVPFLAWMVLYIIAAIAVAMPRSLIYRHKLINDLTKSPVLPYPLNLVRVFSHTNSICLPAFAIVIVVLDGNAAIIALLIVPFVSAALALLFVGAVSPEATPPSCPKCAYPAEGLVFPTNCPECAHSLPSEGAPTTIRYQRRPHLLLTAAAILTSLIGAAAVTLL